MRKALVLGAALIALSTAVFAQPPNDSSLPGPQNPNPPANAPDLRLPPPCSPAPNIAEAGGGVQPAAVHAPALDKQTSAAERLRDTECAANGTTTLHALLPSGPVTPAK